MCVAAMRASSEGLQETADINKTGNTILTAWYLTRHMPFLVSDRQPSYANTQVLQQHMVLFWTHNSNKLLT